MPFVSKLSLPNGGAGASAFEVYQITVKGANVVLIAGEDLTLIDTGFRGCGAQIADSISGLGRSPRELSLIVLTHNHIDHVGGLAELKQTTSAKVAIHRADIGERRGLPSAAAKDVDITLEGGEILDKLGGLEVIHTPGHTPGSISLFSAACKLLIVGDAFRKRRDELLLPFQTTSYDEIAAIKSVQRLSGLDFDTLCFGHGQPMAGEPRAKVVELANRHAN